MLTEVQILDRAEGFADRFENRADGDKWLKRVTSYRLGAMWAKDQSEKELATLRAENAQLKSDIKNLNITIGNAAEWSEKQADELATLRAENARLKLAHENTWQALSRMVAKYEDVHTPAFLAFDEDFLAGRVALSSTKPDPIYAAASEMLEVLENLILEDDAAGGNMTDQTYNSIRAVIRKAKNPIPA